MRKLRHLHSWALWVFFVVSAMRPGPEAPVRNEAPIKTMAGERWGGQVEELACNDTIHLTLDDQCRALVTPDMLLEGDLGCLAPGDFSISIDDPLPGNGAQVDGPGLFRYEIRRNEGATCSHAFSSCTGIIRAEDKTPPRPHCPEPADRAPRDLSVQQLLGTLSDRDDSWAVGDEFCTFSGPLQEAGRRYYDLFRFEVTERTVFTFELRLSDGTPLAALYQEDFHPEVPCRRLLKIARPGDGQTGYFANQGKAAYSFSIELLPGRQYVLLTSTQEAERTTDYNWAVFHQGPGKIAALIERPETVLLPLLCANLDSVLQRPATAAFLGMATADDNCSLPERTGIRDRLLPAADCEDRIVERRFGFRDKSGNTAECTQTITFRQPGLADVVLPPARAFVRCDEAVMLDDDGYPSPEQTGRPYLLTAFGPLFLDEATPCGLGASYRDEASLELCGDTRQINRVWTIVDWCRGEEKHVFSQTITIGDYAGPSLVLPGEEGEGEGHPPALRFSTGPFNCFAAFELPLPTKITDNCSDRWELELTLLGEDGAPLAHFGPEAADYQVSGVPAGRHRIKYLARDACGNETVRTLEVLVADAIDPVAVCNDSLHIGIGGDGRATVSSEEVDEGSWDNCAAEVDLAIRRTVPPECVDAYREQVDTLLTFDETTGQYYTPWREKLDFLCCEIGREITIELRATDEGQLTNTCWLTLRVEDKVPPRCEAPPAVSIPCDTLSFVDFTDTLALQEHFGRAAASDNCGATVRELAPMPELDNCGTGALIRRFQAVDRFGNESAVCTQHITLTPRHHYEIKFPKDAPFYSCGIGEVDSLALNELACDLLAVSRDTTFFEADAEECYKMHIEYRVINWCEYEEGRSPVTVGRDEDGDGRPGDEAVYVLRRPASADSTYIDHNADEGDGFFRTVSSVGYWQYLQVIKVFDDEPPVVEVAPFQEYFCALNGCTAPVDLLFDVNDACTTRQLDYQLEFDEGDDGGRMDLDVNIYIKGRFPKQRISGDFPIGRHAFYLTTTDGCSNFTTVKIPFEVVDCKPPAPVCIERLAVELMAVDVDRDGTADTGANTIWATDFLAGAASDCSDIRYSVNRLGEVPHPDSTSITVTCADPEELFAEVYAWDNAFNPEAIQPDGSVGGPNYSHCIVRIFVQDNRFNLCGRTGPPSGAVAGAIRTETHAPVEEVTVRLSGPSSRTYLTDEDGRYAFGEVLAGYDYSVAPAKEDDPLNGLSTFDILLISKHILGVKPLDSPYKLLAADINRSGSITTIDLIQARKLVLGTIREFPNNRSWRFVSAGHSLSPENPWNAPIPELVNINNLPAGDSLRYDFVAVKVGDVNGNARAGKLPAVAPRQPAGTWLVHTGERRLRPGEVYRVELRPGTLPGIQGCQFTLDFDPAALALQNIDYGLLQEAQLGRRFLEEGMLTASWHSADGALEEPGAVLLALTFRANAAGRLSDYLRLNSRFTPAEAYDAEGNLLDVALRFDAAPATSLLLYQNRPNPFRESTVIGFHLPEPGRITLLVHDLSGRLLLRRSGQYPAGYQEITLWDADLPVAGLLSYTLQTKDRTLTRRMVRLE